MPSEIELKCCVPHVDEFRNRALAAGFKIHTPRTLERNALFDRPDRGLLATRQILRMREYGGKWLLTHKRPPANEVPGARYKERLETETEVANGDAMGAILVELGFKPAFRYEKFRTEFDDTRGAGHLLLDETPIGNFAELEGPPEWIEQAAERLGIQSDLCFTDSYGRMFLDWKARSGSPAENMTFDEIAPEHEMVAS